MKRLIWILIPCLAFAGSGILRVGGNASLPQAWYIVGNLTIQDTTGSSVGGTMAVGKLMVGGRATFDSVKSVGNYFSIYANGKSYWGMKDTTSTGGGSSFGGQLNHSDTLSWASGSGDTRITLISSGQALELNKEFRIRSVGGTAALFGVSNTDANMRAFATDRPIDANNLFQITVDGQHRWGGGTDGGDVHWYRSGTGEMFLGSDIIPHAYFGRANDTYPTSGKGYFGIHTTNVSGTSGGIVFSTLLNGVLYDQVTIDHTGLMTVAGSISASSGTSANWTTAYNERLKWDGGSSGLVPATARTSLGLGNAALIADSNRIVMGSKLIYDNISIGTGYRFQTADYGDASNWYTGWGERKTWDGSSTYLVPATARTSLGLGNAAMWDTTLAQPKNLTTAQLAYKLNIADSSNFNAKSLTTAQLAYKLNITDTSNFNAKSLTTAQLAYKLNISDTSNFNAKSLTLAQLAGYSLKAGSSSITMVGALSSGSIASGFTAIDSTYLSNAIANVVAGTNVTISRSGHTVQINSSGGGGGSPDTVNYIASLTRLRNTIHDSLYATSMNMSAWDANHLPKRTNDSTITNGAYTTSTSSDTVLTSAQVLSAIGTYRGSGGSGGSGLDTTGSIALGSMALTDSAYIKSLFQPKYENITDTATYLQYYDSASVWASKNFVANQYVPKGGATSIVTLGNIATGTWNGTTIDTAKTNAVSKLTGIYGVTATKTAAKDYVLKVDTTVIPSKVSPVFTGVYATTIGGATVNATTLNVGGTSIFAKANTWSAVQTHSKNIVITPSAIAALAIDWTLGNTFTKSISANSTFTWSGMVSGETITVAVTATGAYTTTWPTVTWKGGTQPTQTSTKTDLYIFRYIGTTVYGEVSQNY